MRTRPPSSPNVSAFAEQLQNAMDKRGSRVPADSPEGVALQILGESLREALLREEPSKVDGRVTALRRWMERAKLGEQAIFIDHSYTGLNLAARAYNKEVLLTRGTFLHGTKFDELQTLHKCTLVTVIEDEDGNRLEGVGDPPDNGQGDAEADDP